MTELTQLIVPTGRTVRDLLTDYFAEWHVTQGAFARAIGYSQKHVSQIMLGRSFVHPPTALAFEAATNIPVGVWVALSAEEQVKPMRGRQAEWMRQVEASMNALRATKHTRSIAGRTKPRKATS